MWNEPTKKRLAQIPQLYDTEHLPFNEKKIYLHFFIGGCDWYVAEYDGKDTFFGYVILNNDYQNAEWGYFSFGELKRIKIHGCFEVDCECEISWPIVKAGKIDRIQYARSV